MRLLIARCQVDYAGRLSAHLPMANRLILVKADGSVSVHADDRAYKPLNWMNPPCTVSVRPADADDLVEVWEIRNRDADSLVISIAEVLHDSEHELGTDPGLVKDGVEAHLRRSWPSIRRPSGRAGPSSSASTRRPSGRWTCCSATPAERWWRSR